MTYEDIFIANNPSFFEKENIKNLPEDESFAELVIDLKKESIEALPYDFPAGITFAEYKGDIERRTTGSLVAFETGEAVTYGLFNAQGRGQLFIGAGTFVYEGMVVGMSPKNEDISVNVCKKKHLTNTRAAGSDDALRLETPKIMSLEEAMEFINDDELLEITPKNVRIRKKTLDTEQRLKRKEHGLE